ncbi:hypothetical protein BH18ACT13_BH18ACT13_01700 [soil metagenome]
MTAASLSYWVTRRMLSATRPILGPVSRAVAARYPNQVARITARATRRLSRSRRETAQKAALYLARRAPTNIPPVQGDHFGVTYRLNLRDNVQRDLYYLGGYEQALLSFLADEVRPGDVFVDVGAHIGTIALPMARLVAPDGAVIAFEPALDTAADLERNALRNGIVGLTVVGSALGVRAGQATLRESESKLYHAADMGVRSLHGAGRPIAEVPVISFDEWVTEARIRRLDLVKIDVEGSEYDVLRGMQKSIRAYGPRLLVIEVVPAHLERSGASPQLVEEFLNNEGYQAHGPAISTIATRRVGPYWPNAILRLDPRRSGRSQGSP